MNFEERFSAQESKFLKLEASGDLASMYSKYDPEYSSWILGRLNENNRPESLKNTEKITEDMSMGRFIEKNGDALEFDTNGILITGQHRLKSVVKSGKTFRIPTMFQVRAKNREFRDTNKIRNNKNIFALDSDILYPGSASTEVNAVMMLQELNTEDFKYNLTDADLRVNQKKDFYFKYKQSFDKINEISELAKKEKGRLFTDPEKGALIYAHIKYPNETENFIRGVHGELDLESGSSILAFMHSRYEVEEKLSGYGKRRLRGVTRVLFCLRAFIKSEKIESSKFLPHFQTKKDKKRVPRTTKKKVLEIRDFFVE